MTQSTTWYAANGGIGKVNRDVYDILAQRLSSEWLDFDKWKMTDRGQFAWQKDKLADMVYMVYRQWKSFLFNNLNYWGIATLGQCIGANNNAYTVYSSGNDTVKIYSYDDADTLASGIRVHADGGIYSKQRFLDIATHEHGHYLFGWSHTTHAKMATGAGNGGGWEFSLCPWEVVKLGYIKQELVSYYNPVNYLYDYSSRGIYGADTNEVIQVPITSDGGEFFLIANRRKVSDWDRRMGGDTLALDRWQYLKTINPEYGKGVYIYHVKDAYESNHPSLEGRNEDADIDLECADGLWSWKYAGFSRPIISNPDSSMHVLIRKYPGYDNDYPSSDVTDSTSSDEMSVGIKINNIVRPCVFSSGKSDSYNPLVRGTSSIFTNENDYWYSLAKLGDRWDAWNIGYNEVFSPYSSPNTKAIDNSSTGIFIWYRALDNSNNKATIEIYRVNEGGKSEAQILQLTPPSRPMGLRVLSCDSLPTLYGYKRIKLRWNHNMEPDMENIVQGHQSYTKEYKIYRSMAEDLSSVPPDAMMYPEQYYDEIATVHIDATEIPEFVDENLISVCNGYLCSPPNCWILFPVRYRVQAIDKYDSSSRLSDFAKTRAWNTSQSEGGEEEGEDNLQISNSDLPKEYSLKQNYPNPFNPTTNIQYDLPFDNFVTIKIYDVLGKEVMSLVNEFKNAGSYIISFNGSKLSSGIYFYRLVVSGANPIEAGNFKSVKSMLIIK